MKWAKRIEIWLLIFALIGITTWALFQSTPSWQESPQQAADVETSLSSVKVLEVRGQRDFRNMRLEIDAEISNNTDEDFYLAKPAVRLIIGEDRDAEPFFLPSQRLPQLAPGQTTKITLRYWLKDDDLHEGLRLKVDETIQVIKEIGSYDLTQIENQATAIFVDSKW